VTAKIIVIEGPDRHGKSTQASLLLNSCITSGYKTILLKLPTVMCARTHKLIYKMLVDGRAQRYPNLFQFINFINKLTFQVLYLRKLLDENDVVILDRWNLSSFVYGKATGVNRLLNWLMFRSLKEPFVTIIVHGKSFKRSIEDDCYENDTSLQKRVAELYGEWADDNFASCIKVNNANNDINGMHDEIFVKLLTICAL
jgi:thymidylate kinase